MNEMLQVLGLWQLIVKGIRERMYRAPKARERERWHAIWLLARGWSAAQVAEALERDGGKDSVIPKKVAGISKEQLIRVAGICKNAKFGAIFFGLGLTMSRGKYKNVRNAIELTDELNRQTKFVISPMRGHGNVYGSNEVFTRMTGYPFAVDFARGIAFYNPGETTAVDILRRQECDAALIVASDPGANFPREAAAHLAKIPTVVIDPHLNATTALSHIHIPCTAAGIDAAVTAYRMDGVPIRLKKVIERGYPDDAEILKKIYDRINGGMGS